MVQLKEGRFVLSDVVKEKFQFLNGTIKSAAWMMRNAVPITFQFLNGTIKSFYL